MIFASFLRKQGKLLKLQLILLVLHLALYLLIRPKFSIAILLISLVLWICAQLYQSPWVIPNIWLKVIRKSICDFSIPMRRYQDLLVWLIESQIIMSRVFRLLSVLDSISSSSTGSVPAKFDTKSFYLKYLLTKFKIYVRNYHKVQIYILNFINFTLISYLDYQNDHPILFYL